MGPDDDSRLLREHGLRVTASRLAVLGALRALPGHSSVDEIERAARARAGTLSTQAVYDILKAFHDAALVRRIEPAGSPARYETRVGDNHHHLICRDCGLTVDVDCATGEAPCLAPDDASGFVVDEAEVIYWGRCAACRERKEHA
jgi:Fe2+ or Zn2+ uptake regulation protein